MRTFIGQQGEVAIFKIESLPKMESKPVEKTQAGDFIISHSESGNHHVIGGCDVMERVDHVPEGMRILYAALDDLQSLRQDTGNNPHEKQDLPAGLYEFRISREYDPFAEQARQVAD